MFDFATYFAWFVLALLFAVVVAAIVALGSLPKKIALKRNHPQVDAINAASWMGLLLGGVGWFVAFVWAFVRSGPIGYGDPSSSAVSHDDLQRQLEQLKSRVAELEHQLGSTEREEG